jgi:hypothetical protein
VSLALAAVSASVSVSEASRGAGFSPEQLNCLRNQILAFKRIKVPRLLTSLFLCASAIWGIRTKCPNFVLKPGEFSFMQARRWDAPTRDYTEHHAAASTATAEQRSVCLQCRYGLSDARVPSCCQRSSRVSPRQGTGRFASCNCEAPPAASCCASE